MFTCLAVRPDMIKLLNQRINDPETPQELKAEYKDELAREEAKLRRHAFDNGLRRSNLTGLILESLRQMSKAESANGQSKLEEAISKAREAGKKRNDKSMEVD